MTRNKAALWLSTLLVLGGCGSDPEPLPNPPPDAGVTPQLNQVTVACEPASVTVGQTAQCTASATDQDGRPFTVSGYTWTSSNEAVARVNSTGQVTTLTPGAVTVSASATSGGITRQGQAPFSVNERPPTLHTSNITADETWRAADNPHQVRGQLVVGGPGAPTLTLEAGVELRFEPEAELRVSDGALRALGTQDAPIRMVSSQRPSSPGDWRGVVFTTAGSASELNNVTLSDCGKDSGDDACISLKNGAAPVLRSVSVNNSGTAGVAVADDGSAFGAGSVQLSISGSRGYAVRMSANQASTLPTSGTFSGNAPDAVELTGDVSRTQVWPNPGIPYVVADLLHVEDATRPVLTLSAGTVVRFARDTGLLVGSSNFGELIIAGTETSPVLLTADASSPQPGHWRGVHLEPLSSNASRLSHVTIEYAGANGSEGTGNLNLYGHWANITIRPIIENVILQKGSGYGLVMLDGGGFGQASTGLTVRDNGGYAIATNANTAGTIPANSIITGNTLNAVELKCCGVNTTQTWPNLGVPYIINFNFWIEGASAPKLTLMPGTEIRFGPGVDVQIGRMGPGALIAEGTAQAPIRFVPNTATPARGHWRGMHFWQAAGSKLDYVLVSHAGAEGSIGRGNVNVYNEIGALITNSTITQSSYCGVTISGGTAPGTTPVQTDYLRAEYNNTVSSNTSGSQCVN